MRDVTVAIGALELDGGEGSPAVELERTDRDRDVAHRG